MIGVGGGGPLSAYVTCPLFLEVHGDSLLFQPLCVACHCTACCMSNLRIHDCHLVDSVNVRNQGPYQKRREESPGV